MPVELMVALIGGSAAGGVLSAMLAVGAWRERSVPGAEAFGWLMVAVAGWCLLNIGWLTASDPGVARSVFLLTRLTSGLIVGLWVVFALVYTGREKWLTPARLAGLLILPSSYAVLGLTNPVHGLVTAETARLTQGGLTLFVGETGVVYLLQNGLSVGFIAAGYVLLGEFLLRSRNLYRKQTFIILTAGLLTAGVHGLFLLGVTPHPGLDITPLTFALNGVLVGVALFRYDFVSVAPLAGDLLVDELPDPVFVLDADDNVIDYNAAATALFDESSLGGRATDDIAPELLDDIERGEVFGLGKPLTYYDPQKSAITDQYGTTRGRLVVLREVTGQQRRQERLESLQSTTQQFIEADQPGTVTRLAVAFVADVLGREAAVLLCDGSGHLEPSAVSDALSEYAEDGTLRIDSETQPNHAVWETYDSGDQRVTQVDSDIGPLTTALLVPLGDHGVFAIDSERGQHAAGERQYAEVLAHTTQVALEQVDRERELRRSRTSVKRRNDQVEFFNGVLRHSLRNAMLVVQGRAEHLQDRVDAEHRDHVDSIATWCERLTEMSGTIRDINETVTASESERLEPVSLSAAVRDAVRNATDGREGVAVATDIDATEWIRANDLAAKVLASVVENAVVHNTSEEPRVEITTQDAGDWIQVRVADNGPGISDELKTTMFEGSMSPDQTAGGFGLYFVSVMMGLYGGKVWHEDNEPGGAVAILEFQRADRDSELAPAGAAGGEAQHKSPDD